MNGMQLYDEDGQRRYLTPEERDAFLKAAEDVPRASFFGTGAAKTAWARACGVMEAADIIGPPAMPTGLRHAFGIKVVGSQAPLNMVQRWLGHAELSTTVIYVDAVGAEAKQIAQRTRG